VLNLLMDLRDRQGLAYVFISHDLAVVETIADRIAVMYRGRFVEIGPAEAVFRRPLHPYTRRLIEAEPRIDAPKARIRRGATTAAATGAEADAAAGWHSACAFAPRCPHAKMECVRRTPALPAVDADHEAACHFAGEI